ncbi:hypothetical protein CXG81DRAFT_10343 [Caulochytrium protostelioides]|uniref:Protein FAM72 n=1 Tax=Caulochytrium protostelioides TaxID=1555241 RepID=A0A4P9XBM1_9FUNG|nr:hypothetical protein CXG81DRAFT_10343 [Caulochytrium protostelioides]|eukprot:RKP02798.1 hypothetical protein CXG81DRAFT_10343 [Caulochytrium protostelioides]
MIDVDANRTAWVISCRGCRTRVSQRGIRAVLLADNQVHLFSTDLPPEGCMLMDGIYQTDNCACLIKDTGCRTCGNVLGYHISRPCAQCLSSPNNGHLWIFSSNAICSEERRSKSTDDIMIWGQLPRVEKSESHEMLDQYDQHCR